ncbi:MAG: magnesium chelatase family protein, partial [Candidatus Parcubacteria bacterium]|nr:magnesium chelatase family protein [Candidatus Parcubacteria bacterium]
MSIAKTYSAQLTGLETEIVTVEVDISHGLHAFSVVGLGDRSIDEARDRISAAIKNSGYVSPKQKNQKVIISLAPADLRKEGPSFDLPMAVAYLSAAGEIEFDASRKLILGELSLEGRVRRISGLLPILCRAPALGFTEAFVPKANESEASLAEGMTIFGVGTLGEIVDHVSNKKKLEPVRAGGLVRVTGDALHDVADNASQMLDMSAIRGNESAKRGLEIAAGGAHNVI